MPIEITELVIKAQVGDSQQNERPSAASSSTGQAADQAATKALERAVKQAVDIIKRKNER